MELASATASELQPNIVFVLLDDVGFADLSYNHDAKMIPTPNIDKLAHKGIIFDWHYSHPTCTPSRASLMTGKYSANVGLSFAMVINKKNLCINHVVCICSIFVFDSFTHS
jgi:arylsulfatase A-like enzyme